MISIDDVTVRERDRGTTSAAFRVRLNKRSRNPIRVDYVTADGAATSPDDYESAAGTLIFAPGQNTRMLDVHVNGDTDFEEDEQFEVQLSAPVNATIADGTAVGTIVNDDPQPKISIGNATVTEGNLGFTLATFTVSLSALSFQTVLVDYETADGTAIAPGDYSPAIDTLVFGPGETTADVTILVQGDAAPENDESFFVNLNSPVNATLFDSHGLGTILSDDSLPRLSIGNATVTEGNTGTATATFTVSLSAASGQTVTVDYATSDGTAAQPGDYQLASGTLTFSAGETSKTVGVLVNGDTTLEANETFTVALTSPTNATISGTGIGTGTITDDDSPTISIGNATVTEGSSGTANAVFAVTLSPASASTVTVNYSTFDGSAVAPGDYASQTGTLTFTPGQTAKTITVVVNGDTSIEPNETFTVNLSSPANANISGTGVATGTITNDDSLPTLTIAAVTVTEGNSGTVNAAFAVTLSAASASTVTVDYATFDGSAVAPGDYASQTGTLTFTAGQTAKQVVVLVNGDTSIEASETFTVALSNPANATISGTGVATGTITNDDSLPTISIANVTVTEGNSGTVSAAFAVTLSAVSANTVTVDYSTFDASAVAPGDYATQTGTLTFTPGQTSKTIAVLVNGDTSIEANETFTVALSNPANATISGSGIGTGTITNDDSLPTLAIANVTVTEGNSGTVNAVFAVTLSAASASTVTVDYATFDGSAVAPGDYASASGTLTFTAGQTAKQVIVTVNGDTSIEPNETFTVNLSNPANATISGTGVATGTITNDDSLPTLTIAAATVTEGNSGTVNAVFTVTLSAASASTVTVDYSTFDGSAVAPGDYVATSGTLTFTAGQTSKQILVAVKGETLNEVNETFTVNLSNPANATISGTGIATGTITNDDAVPTVSINNVSVAEGNSGTTSFTFTVTLSAASGLAVTVDYATADGSAVAPGDYAAQTGTLTFSPGQTTKTITILVNGDITTEANETFTVTLSNSVNATISGGGIGTGTITNDD